jgi:hypothetical protein
MPVSVRFPSVRVLSILVLGTVAAALPVATALSAPKQGKQYEMVVESPEWAGVTDSSYTVTITNTTGTQQLGSANLTIPSTAPGVADFTVVSEPTLDPATAARGATIARPGGGKVIELRNLALAAAPNPNSSVTVTLGLRMPCAAAPYRWNVDARQSNDFSGTPGNTLGPVTGTLATTVEGSCKLRFVDQPASALAGTQIRADELAPESTHFVTVEAVDGSPAPQRLTWFGDPVRLTSDPTGLPQTSSNASAGLATFTDLVIQSSGNYTLLPATDAAGFGGIPSSVFQVVGVQVDCNPAQCFTPKLPGDKGTNASLTGSDVTGAGSALLSLKLGTDPLFSNGCSAYTPPGGRAGGDYYEFRLFEAEADTTFVMEYSKAALGKRTPSSLEVCFAAPGPAFVAKDGAVADAFDYDGPGPGTEGFADLLPNCPSRPTQPCVLGRGGISGGGAAVTVFVPRLWSGDPRMH